MKIFKSLAKLLFLLFIVLALYGCTIKLGVEFDGTKAELIEVGKMNMEQIEKLLGPPSSVGIKNNNSLWTYIYAEISLIRSDAYGTVLSVEFDKKGIVETFTYIPY